ncbi:DUF2515 domain-containing protein [Brevibacillus sp. SAFN-007a]|uniref:DUF2515 domain-containing protein n=1 Tax=Brevibacillus sp. SAFN-007a TaxID=3436862 RepID=UPI003F815AC0
MGWSWPANPALWPLARELVKATETRQAAKSPLPHERETVAEIRHKTEASNGDNVDRTSAYLTFFRKHPEVHWALLAHLVSRNAGWSMTDLRGELLPRLLPANVQQDYFSFLERGNWLIFHDAYPQLLLYEESVKRQTTLFHLLPELHVSVFMQAVWNHFWKTGDSKLLTVGLIMNEQHYLETHMMSDETYQTTVVKTLPFALQEVLRLNLILFPYRAEGQEDGALRLAGAPVFHFASLAERIELGKRLYSLLFTSLRLREGAIQWASDKPHTGSRKDFWPHLFHDLRETAPGKAHQKKLGGCQLLPGANRLYSPALRHVWKQVRHEAPKAADWYPATKGVMRQLLLSREQPASFCAEEAYCQALEKIERAVLAKGKLFGS